MSEVREKAASSFVPASVGRLHSRLANLNPRTESWVILLGCLLAALAYTLPLVLPGRTLSFKYVHDLMIFFDGAHRVLDGQLPNRDFHTPLGLLAYLLPALGLWLGGLGGMMPLATAAFLLIFLPLLIHVCISRLPLAYAVLFALFAAALIVTPASIGETTPSFGMFYNRWGYALLALLFLLVLPQRRGQRRVWADALIGAAVLLLTFYLKISYFAVAAGFTVLLLLFRDSRKMAALALAIAASGIVLVHLFWGGTATYVSDIGMAAQVTGAVRASLLGIIRMTFENAGMIIPFLIALGLAVARGVSVRTLFLCAVMAGAGLLLYNQNFQGPGMMTLVPAAILAALALPRSESGTDKDGLALTALLLVAILTLPTAILAVQSVFMHSYLAMRGGDPREYVADIDGFLAQEVTRPAPGDVGFEDARQIYRAGSADLNTLKILRSQPLRQVLAQPEYFWTLQDGAGLLRGDPRLGGKVLALDMANPLNAVTGRSAPAGLDSWYHAARTFNEKTFRNPEQMFADVDVVMVPVAPVDPASHLLLSRLYGSHIQRHYDLAASSDYWRAYVRKGQ
ncbi:MAG TPA: hypothetical protein VK391_08315 [Allosphingosinicella sp.]|nr:hypothetical protein [Allosphingosinicella sp.]